MVMNPRQILSAAFTANGGIADFRPQPNTPVPLVLPAPVGTSNFWVKGHSFQLGERVWQNNNAVKVVGLVFHWFLAQDTGVETSLANKINPLLASEVYYFRTTDMAWMGTAVTQLYPTIGSFLRIPELTQNLTFWIKNDTPVAAPEVSNVDQSFYCSVRAGKPLITAPSIMNSSSATMSNNVIASKIPLTINWRTEGTKLKFGSTGLNFRIETLNNKIDQVEVKLGSTNTTLLKV